MLNINQLFDNHKSLINWIILFIVLGYFIQNASKQKQLFQLFKGKHQQINLAIILVSSLFMIFYKGNNKEEYELRIDALKKAMFGFLIAVMAHIGMVIAPFWIIFFIAYHLNGWV